MSRCLFRLGLMRWRPIPVRIACHTRKPSWECVMQSPTQHGVPSWKPAFTQTSTRIVEGLLCIARYQFFCTQRKPRKLWFTGHISWASWVILGIFLGSLGAPNLTGSWPVEPGKNIVTKVQVSDALDSLNVGQHMANDIPRRLAPFGEPFWVLATLK